MILINLLPHREAARKRRRDAFNVALVASALLGGLVAGAIYLWYQSEISDQQGSNRILSVEIAKLEGQIKEIGGLESEIAALKARQLCSLFRAARATAACIRNRHLRAWCRVAPKAVCWEFCLVLSA